MNVKLIILVTYWITLLIDKKDIFLDFVSSIGKTTLIEYGKKLTSFLEPEKKEIIDNNSNNNIFYLSLLGIIATLIILIIAYFIFKRKKEK